MMKNNDKRKGNNAKKILPAAGMLALSASMLATSTYAWFTMSREVEVQNIKLTASVPEDLQISLGKLDTADGSGNGYMNNYGVLVKASGDNANNGRVDAPRDVIEDWASTVDVSKYYALGTILPASSTDGQDVFFTPDAAGVGKNLKTGAKFYKAVDNATPENDTSVTTNKEYTGTYETTLHAFTTNDKTNATINQLWTADAATAYNVTNDSGYYVDIPVWIRSGAKEAVTLGVDAYVTTNSTIDGDDLYLAARAVILDSNKTNTSKLLEIKKDNFESFESIVNFMDSTNASGEAVASLNGTNPVYGTQPHYTGAKLTDTFQVAAAGANDNYGTATKVWVRVWLEGEDPNCWNDNAGQDFNISLRFTKDALVQATAADGSAPEGANYPKANAWTDVANDTANSIKAGDTISVTGSITDANDNTKTVNINMVYTYNGTAWERTSGSYPGKAVKIGGKEYANEAAFITYLNSLTKKSEAVAMTLSE